MKQLKMKQRNRGGFHSISLGTLAASVLRNLLYGKDVAAKGLRQKTIKAGDGAIARKNRIIAGNNF